MDISVFVWPFLIPLAIVIGLGGVGFVIYLLGYLEGKQDASAKQKISKKFTRSVLGGLFSEQVAPFLPNFPTDLKASEARFVGKPVDFLIFKGMDEQNITEVVFVEVKTGKSDLTKNERALRDVINAGKVRWCEYRVGSEVSNLSTEL